MSNSTPITKQDLQEALDPLKNEQWSFKKSLMEMKKDQEIMKKDQAIMKKDQEIMKEDIYPLKCDVGSLQYKMGEVQEDVKDLKTGFSKMLGMMEYLVAAVDDLKTEKTMADFSNKQTNSRTEKNSQKIEQLEQRVEFLEAA